MIEPEPFLKFLKERRTIRAFQDKEISEDKIEMILEAGRYSPSASNKQPWQFIVIKNKDVLDQISKAAFYGRFIKTAPIAIAIVGKMNQSPKWYVIDTSLVSMSMMLMAWSLNIGTCWIGALNREKAKQILDLGKNDYLLTVLPMGYIQGKIPNPTPRKSLDKIKKEIT